MRSGERELLVQATCEASDARRSALQSLLARALDLDWDQVLALAAFHGVLPLVQRALDEDGLRRAVPEGAWEALEMGATLTMLKNASLLHALQRILAALQADDITPLVLKGPVLAATIYPEVGLRPFSDLDLLCPRHQLAVSYRALRRLGYHAAAQNPWEQDDFHVVYGRPDSATTVELHSDLLQLGVPTRCMAGLWEAAETCLIQAIPVQALGLEHLLLHLCVHMHTHGYCRLIWFKDLDLLLRSRGSEVQWSHLWRLAQDEGVVLSISHTLHLLHSLLQTPLPAGAFQVPRVGAVHEIAHSVLWPQRRVLRLQSKQRLRSVRFNPRLGIAGVLPNLIVMGRRREKIALLVARTRGSSGGASSAPTEREDRARGQVYR